MKICGYEGKLFVLVTYVGVNFPPSHVTDPRPRNLGLTHRWGGGVEGPRHRSVKEGVKGKSK